MAYKRIAPTRNDERNRKILKMRREGFTYKEIGIQFGISIERARQIAQAQARRENEPNMCDILTVRVRNALFRSGIKTEQEIIQKIEDGSIYKVRNIGEKSIDLLKYIYGLE